MANQYKMISATVFKDRLNKVNLQLQNMLAKQSLVPKVYELPEIDDVNYVVGSKVYNINDASIYIVNEGKQWELYKQYPNYYNKTISDSRYQSTLRSGVNIKTINGYPVLGSGDLSLRLGTEIPLENVWTIDQVQNFVRTQIASLINSAPDTLDTLGELATALKQNNDVVVTLNAAIAEKADKAYVDQAIQNSFDTMFETLMDLEV